MICRIDFDNLPDDAKIVLAKGIIGKVTYDARYDENSREQIIIKNSSVKEVRKIIKSKGITELDITVFTL